MMRRLDADIARVFFVSDDDLEFPNIPNGFVLRHSDTATDAARFQNSFIITWTSSYMLLYHDKIAMFIDSQRQQSYLCLDA